MRNITFCVVIKKEKMQESLERGETAEFKIKGLTLNRKFSVIYHRNKFLPKSAMALMDLCKGNA